MFAMKYLFWSFIFLSLVTALYITYSASIKRKIIDQVMIGAETDSVRVVLDSNFNMINKIEELKNNSGFSEYDGFYNDKGVEHYKKELSLLKDQEIKKRHEVLQNLAEQYLLAGYPDSSIKLINRLNKRTGSKEFSFNVNFEKQILNWLNVGSFTNSVIQSKNNRHVKLGLCYLRKGEQKNCQINHNAESCIMPFSQKAVHKYKKGSKLAIHHFKQALDQKPGNQVSQWLLNIAYMTIGQYPRGVPDSELINFNKYTSKEKVGDFRNIAGQLDVDRLTFYGGSCTEDFNNDGYLDLFTTSADLRTNVTLYMNHGKGGFQDYTEEAELEGITGGVNTIHGDYNNDGYEDIYIIRGGWLMESGKYHPNSLLRNNGDGTFTDVTARAGLLSYWATHTACWGDVNQDGYLDLFVGNELNRSHLFLNQGDGTFREIAAQTGIKVSDFVKGATWIDYDNDSDLDLYLSSFGGYNHLFENIGTNDKTSLPKFEEVTDKAGVSLPFFGFPVVSLDFNNDGYQDLFCAENIPSMKDYANAFIHEEPLFCQPKLYINNGDGTFSEKWQEYGDNRQTLAMGMNVGDINNDGYQDIYIGTGYPDFVALVPNLMYLNEKGKGLADVTLQGFGHLQKGHGISFGDLNKDGDQDIYMNVGGYYTADKFFNVLYQNPGHQNNWIVIELIGKESNSSAIGAKLKLIVKDRQGNKRKIWRTVSTGGSFGASSLQQEIGLGISDTVEKIVVYWPNKENSKQVFQDIKVNQKIIITENEYEIQYPSYQSYSFNKDTSNSHHHHKMSQ